MIRGLIRKALSWFKSQDVSYLYALLGEGTLALTFVFYALLARVLGPEQNGVFTAAVSLGGILGVFIQFGLPVLLNREVARSPARGSPVTLMFLAVQAINTVPVLIVLPFILRLLGFTREGMFVCYIVIFSELFRSAKMLWRGVMKGHGWFRMEAVSVGIERLFVVLCSGAVLLITQNLVLVVATLAVARLADNISIGCYLGRKVRLWTAVHREALIAAYRKAYPFALHGLLWILYYQVDILMLKAMSSSEEVGYYGAAYRVLEIFSALPRVVFYVSFTRFAESHARNPAELPEWVYQSVRMLLLLVLPCIVAAGYVQQMMMRLIYGEAYLASIILLATLLPSLGVKMFSMLSEEYLLATGRERKLPALMFAVAASNILVNLILIPRYGALGAAIATGISECVFCALGMNLVIRYGLGRIARRLIGIALSCLGLVVAPSLLVFGFPAWTALLLSAPCAVLIVLFMNSKASDRAG